MLLIWVLRDAPLGATARALAETAGLKTDRVRRTLPDLVARGWAARSGWVLTPTIRTPTDIPAGVRWGRLYRSWHSRLRSHPHLAAAAVRLTAHLGAAELGSCSAGDIAHQFGLGRRGVEQALTDLDALGIIHRTAGRTGLKQTVAIVTNDNTARLSATLCASQCHLIDRDTPYIPQSLFTDRREDSPQ